MSTTRKLGLSLVLVTGFATTIERMSAGDGVGRHFRVQRGVWKRLK
jgi:hypothetical protein